jgi:hypothetical protein
VNIKNVDSYGKQTSGVTSNIDVGLRAHMNKVYALMSIGLFLTGGVAYIVGSNEMLFLSLFTGMSRYVIMFAPLVVVFAMGSMINRLKASTAQMIFYAFSALMGLSISYIFVIYTSVSITQIFLITAIAFAGLSIYGYSTKRDISGMRSFLVMGVWGVFVAMIVNMWMQSAGLMYAISIIGVLVFAGLTAYDTQRIKNTYIQMAQNGQSEWIEKSAILGALSLYINFLQMFIFLLHLFGNRN